MNLDLLYTRNLFMFLKASWETLLEENMDATLSPSGNSRC